MSRRFYVQWHLLNRCILRCQHCYQENFSKKGELTLSEIKKVTANLLDGMKKWGTKLDVALTGGEPFLKKELRSLLDILNRSVSVEEISIITSGLIIPSWLEELKKFKKFREIRISLDGVTFQTNDSIRGSGIFERVLRNIEKIKGCKIPFVIMFTAMKRNYHEIPLLVDFCRETGAKEFIVERFFPIGRGERWANEVLSGKEFLNVWQKMLNKFSLFAEPEDLIPYRAIKVEIGSKKPRIYGSGCVVGRDGMALMPDGTIFPCRRFPLPIGNLLNESLDKIWSNSAILKKLRKKENLKGNCYRCPVKGCYGCRAMCYVLTGDPFSGDPHCWLRPYAYRT